jgi:predicted TIM-barrel fold metal-dependent hydrolase
MRVVDPHIHLWDMRVVTYPWLVNPGKAYSGDNRLLPPLYDVPALLRDAQDIEILASVAVEANPEDAVAEARWLQLVAEDPAGGGHPHGIVAFADLSRADATRTLAELSRIANVRGIRQILNIHADPRYNYVHRDYLSDPLWRENLSRLAQYRWSFDLQIYPAQAQAAAEVIGHNPDIRFIINHAGMLVDRGSDHDWHQWLTALRQLAQHGNVAIKLSGLAMFDHEWTVESFRPLVLEAIECFGTERCMFASNFPIDGLHGSYPSIWRAYAQIVAGLTTGEQNDLFINNAIRYYDLRPVSRR